MKLHRIRPDHSLAPAVLDILRAVHQETAALGINYMIVGATARDILLTHVHGIAQRRATHDIDLAVAAESWGQFERLKSALATRDGFAASERMQQRIYYGGQEKEQGYPLDFVPFGGVERATNEIAWPPDMAVIMNVAGYEEVLRSSESVELELGLIVRVASLAGIAVLKLVAWSDRGKENPKDAHDLYQLMTNYADAGNTDRLYGDDFSILEAADYDPDPAGACLLGIDIARLASEAMRKHLLAILEQGHEPLSREMVKSIQHTNEPQAAVELRMRQFRAGLLKAS